MNCSQTSNTNRALTLVEVLVSIFVVFLVALFVLPALMPARPRASKINCISNIKQVGLAFRMWSNDNRERFPWQVSLAETGTLEFAESQAVYRHFAAVSNELSSPKVLACNADKKVSKQADWNQFNNANLSYFVGLEANEAYPQTILSGDRNLATNGKPAAGILRVTADTPLGFTQEMHKHAGNIGLGDGSATQVTDNSLRRQIQAALQSTNVAALRFSIPKPN